MSTSSLCCFVSFSLKDVFTVSFNLFLIPKKLRKIPLLFGYPSTSSVERRIIRPSPFGPQKVRTKSAGLLGQCQQKGQRFFS